jgi:hypothetical protein
MPKVKKLSPGSTRPHTIAEIAVDVVRRPWDCRRHTMELLFVALQQSNMDTNAPCDGELDEYFNCHDALEAAAQAIVESGDLQPLRDVVARIRLIASDPRKLPKP